MFSEDLSVFFSLDTPGSASANTGAADFVVLMDNGYQGALAGFVESTGPSCMARTSDVAALVQGSSITIAATAYKVASVQPDGYGVTTLLLELA